MTMITDLPIEVIYVILQQKVIDIEDVIQFSLTCRRFNDAFDNLLWKTKLYQSFDIRWPYLKKIYDNRIKNNESINFKDEVTANVKCREALFSYLSLLSEKLFNELEPYNGDIKNFDILFRPNIGPRTMNYHFLKDELLYQIDMSSLDPKCNLTHQFYSKKLLPFLQRRHLEDVWLEFINYPKEQQLLENAATILAQWYQPKKRIYNFDIEASLDDIAQQTLNSLKEAHWDHPIFSTSADQFSFWKYNNIDNNQWSKIEEKQIIDTLLTVLFDELGFHLHSDSIEDIFIDCVLENKIGNSIILAIIFQSVARRLGVRCDLVGSDLGCLCWKPKFIAENPKDEECFYIDIVHGGTIRGRNDCPIESYNKHTKMSPTEMVFFMHKAPTDIFVDQDRTQQIVELLDYVYADSIGEYYCKYYNIMNMSDFLCLCQSSLQEIQNNYNNRKFVEASRRTKDILRTFEKSVQCMNANLQISRNLIVPKNRTRNIKYAVGMIVTCITNNLNQTGVIIGWDEKLNSNININCMYTIVFSDSQTRTAKQPFYVILTENGNAYYAAQDILIRTRPRWIEHNDISRYFCRFTNIHYVPNEVLTRRYPYDQDILNNYSARCFHKIICKPS